MSVFHCGHRMNLLMATTCAAEFVSKVRSADRAGVVSPRQATHRDEDGAVGSKRSKDKTMRFVSKFNGEI